MLVGEGKNHAVSVGSIVATPSLPVPVAVADAGAGDVSVRTPHCTSLPLYVCVWEKSVGPVVLPLVKAEPNDEYSVHVAAVVEASWHEMRAVLFRGGSAIYVLVIEQAKWLIGP